MQVVDMLGHALYETALTVFCLLLGGMIGWLVSVALTGGMTDWAVVAAALAVVYAHT